MESYFDKVRNHLLELKLQVSFEDEADGIFVVDDEDSGLTKLVIGVADPILIMEQYLLDIVEESTEVYKSLLQKNRDMLHGAFVLDESGEKLIFRNTLELENLDLNELEAAINALSLLLSEYHDILIELSKPKN